MGYEGTMHRSSFETSFHLKSMEPNCTALSLDRTQTITHEAALSFNQVVGKGAIHQGVVRSVVPQSIHCKASINFHPIIHFRDGQKCSQLAVLPGTQVNTFRHTGDTTEVL